MAENIAKEFKLKHKIFNLTGELDNFPIPKKSIYHKRELIKTYKENFTKDTIYLRGQIFEIPLSGSTKMSPYRVKLIGKQLNKNINNLSYQDYKEIMYQFWKRKNSKLKDYFIEFDKYFDEINYKYIIDNHLEHLDVFYYWEHHQGTWLGPAVYGDSDHAFETLVPINNWYLFYMLLLLPYDKRNKKDTGFQKTLIRNNNKKLGEITYS